MSADEYASKELQQWRKAEAAKDIEAIKTHELDMLALGNTFVMKSHKGEQVIEKSEIDAVSSSTTEAVLPENQEEILEADKTSLESDKKSSDEAKSPRKKSKKSERDRDRHRHSSSSKSHSSSSSSHKDKKSSRDKDKHSSSSKSDGKKHHSSSKSSSSSKSHSSSDKKDKEKKSGDRKKHSSGSLAKSSSVDKVAEIIGSTDTGVSSPSTSELDELQARINKATAAIEAAKKSVASLSVVTNNPSEEEAEVSQGLEEEDAPGSPLDLDLPDLGSEPRRTGTDGEVSSTVTIPTPEQALEEAWSQPEEPSVWKGQVMMQDVAKFSVSAFQVSGTSDYLSVDLKSSLELVGRIPPSVCWDYINKIGKNPTKEIIVLKLSPSNDDEKDNYQSFFTYLNTRDRFGVVGNCNKNVKDCYIMPLGSAQPMPSALLPMSGQGLPDTRPDLLLTIIVRNRRTRPNDPLPSTSLSFKQAPSTPAFPPVRSKILPNLPPPFVPPTLPTPVMAADDDNAPYSPGSSPEELGLHQAPKSEDLGLTEKLARLQAEVAAKRAALAMREHEHVPAPEPPMQQPVGGFFGPGQNVGMFQPNMPPQAPPIQPPPFISTSANQPPFPFPVANKPMGGGSSLSRMSDADLLAAAAAMEQPPVKKALPPPGVIEQRK